MGRPGSGGPSPTAVAGATSACGRWRTSRRPTTPTTRRCWPRAWRRPRPSVVGLRAEVYELDDGRCVGCGAKLDRGADAWSWQVHHALKVQTMKARGLRPKWWRGAALAVLTCRKCHMAHEARTATIPLERLPERVHRSVAILGPWAVDLLARSHPPAA